MKRYFVVLLFICISTYLHSQDGNQWNTFFEGAIKLNESKEYISAEKLFKKAQQSLIEEYGLNDATIPTYCHVLYQRAHNLFLIDELVDSAYLCFKELHQKNILFQAAKVRNFQILPKFAPLKWDP